MFNNTKTNVIERNTYVDEFETLTTSNVATEPLLNTKEARAFNSRIADNFDKIIHYDSYNAQTSVQERNQTYEMYSSAVNVDANPSSTTMQFRGMPKAEIYQDYKVNETVESKTVVRPRGKLLLVALSLIVCALSTLVIFNTALLKNLDSIIAEKDSIVQSLNDEKVALDKVLEDVSK